MEEKVTDENRTKKTQDTSDTQGSIVSESFDALKNLSHDEESNEQEEVLQNELDEANDRYLRLVADMDNLRKRTSKEVLDAKKFALESFFAQLLPVLDSFDQALHAIGSDSAQLDGILMIRKNLFNVLESQGFSELNPQGEVFDPNLHQAIQKVDSVDVSHDTVTQVFAKGYLLNGRLLRPAMVSVAIADQK